jgi:hypothetical protein
VRGVLARRPVGEAPGAHAGVKTGEFDLRHDLLLLLLVETLLLVMSMSLVLGRGRGAASP